MIEELCHVTMVMTNSFLELSPDCSVNTRNEFTKRFSKVIRVDLAHVLDVTDYSRIFSSSFRCLLFSKLFRHNKRTPTLKSLWRIAW